MRLSSYPTGRSFFVEHPVHSHVYQKESEASLFSFMFLNLIKNSILPAMFKSGINKQKRIFQISSLISDIPPSNLLEKVYCYIF